MRNFFKKYGAEWLLTFSNKPSFFSSKKLERALLITVALTLMCFFIYYNRHTLGPWEFLGLITPLFGYAGFNTVQTRIDRKEEKKDMPLSNTNNPVEPTDPNNPVEPTDPK
jgi:hypothetical protein